MRYFGFISILCFFLTSAALVVPGQRRCLDPGKLEEIKKQLAGTDSPAENKKLHDQFVAAATELVARNRREVIDVDRGKTSTKDLDSLKQDYTSLVCSQLNKQGWPMRSMIGRDGLNSFFFLIAKALPTDMQFEIYPIVYAAFEKGEIERGELMASFIDRLRLQIGRAHV